MTGAVVGWYQRYLEDGEGKVLARAIRGIVGPGSNDVSEAKRRAEEELEGLRRTIANLLDNITVANRGYVDERLARLGAEKEIVDRRIEEFDRMALSSSEIETLVQETWDFMRGLEFVLEKGPPEERIRAIRQCIESIVIAPDTTGCVLRVRALPSARLRGAIDEVRITLGPIDASTALLRGYQSG